MTYVLVLRWNFPCFLHPGLCNDAVSVWERQSAFILTELLGCLAQHGRRSVGNQLLSPPQQHLRTRQKRDQKRWREKGGDGRRDQHEDQQCHSRWTTTMRIKEENVLLSETDTIIDGRVLLHSIKARMKSSNPSHTASFLSATSNYSEFSPQHLNQDAFERL